MASHGGRVYSPQVVCCDCTRWQSLHDGRVWKRHVDQMRRAEIATSSPGIAPGEKHSEILTKLTPLTDPSLLVDAQTPCQMQDTQEHTSTPKADIKVQDTQHKASTKGDISKAPPQPLRRSTRVSKPPTRLIETMS